MKHVDENRCKDFNTLSTQMMSSILDLTKSEYEWLLNFMPLVVYILVYTSIYVYIVYTIYSIKYILVYISYIYYTEYTINTTLYI